MWKESSLWMSLANSPIRRGATRLCLTFQSGLFFSPAFSVGSFDRDPCLRLRLSPLCSKSKSIVFHSRSVRTWEKLCTDHWKEDPSQPLFPMQALCNCRDIGLSCWSRRVACEGAMYAKCQGRSFLGRLWTV